MGTTGLDQQSLDQAVGVDLSSLREPCTYQWCGMGRNH
jgi:hypothetical protein